MFGGLAFLREGHMFVGILGPALMARIGPDDYEGALREPHVRKMDFSYKDGEDFVFSDPETYETVNMSPELVGDAKSYLVENGQATVTFVEDKAVQVEIPPSVVLTVANAPEGIKGDSANNVMKSAMLETGVSVLVPLFIKTGEKIKVDTRTGKYMERA